MPGVTSRNVEVLNAIDRNAASAVAAAGSNVTADGMAIASRSSVTLSERSSRPMVTPPRANAAAAAADPCDPFALLGSVGN